jgi:hypothetical protein
MTCCTTVLVALAAEMRAVRIRHELLHDEGESYLMRVLEVFHIDLLAIREHLFALPMLRVHLRRRQAVVCTQTAGIVRRVCVCVSNDCGALNASKTKQQQRWRWRRRSEGSTSARN